MDELIRYYQKIVMRILLFPMRLLPIKKNRVSVNNILSNNYSGNPKYVTEYLTKYYPGKFDIVISVKEPEKYQILKSKGMKVVRFNSFKYFFYAMTSKVFLTNSGGFSYIPLRKTQIVINTWHGGGAYKKIGIFMYNNTPMFRKDLMLSSRSTTVFLSTCQKATEFISASLLIPKEKFWEIGMPRNDLLFNIDEKDEKVYYQLREKLGLKKGEYLVLYAPTYRKPNDNYFKESIAISYGIDCRRVCVALEKKFGGIWKFAFRLHPCVTNRDLLPEGNIIDLSDYEDMQELLLAADVMINDFSSSMWDFMLTGRPSFLFAMDFEHYIKTTEVEIPVSEWPFSKSINNDELEKNILEFDEEKYREACKKYYCNLGGCETGNASKLVSEYIDEKCSGTRKYE